MDNADISWDKKRLGQWVRFLRTDRGLSLASLGELSGVIPSEIYRVEIGQQECRLLSLVLICGPLGITPGWLLDRSLHCDPGIFRTKLNSPELWPLMRRLGIADDATVEYVVGILSSACSLAAILIRASDPMSRVQAETFPHAGWRDKFAPFAEKIAALGGENLDRAVMLHNLIHSPFRELSGQDLIAEKALSDQAENYGLPKEKRRREMVGWSPWLDFPRKIKDDYWEPSVKKSGKSGRRPKLTA